MTYLVQINGDPYAVKPDTVADVQARILDAVHAGGAFVTVPHLYGPPVSVLVTPGAVVRIEEITEIIPSTVHKGDLAFLDVDL